MKNILLFLLLCTSLSLSYSQSDPIYCGAMTKKGHPCKNKVTEHGAKCWMHGGPKKTDVRLVAAQCSATAKSTGKQCRNKTVDKSGLCHVHNVLHKTSKGM